MCFQEMEIYTCTTEIPAIGPEDWSSITCGCSIAARGTEGRYKAMPGAPHKVTEFPVYCEKSRKNGMAGTHCPDFEIRWIYKPDPQGRSCYEHAATEDAAETAVLERERRRLSNDWKREGDRSRAKYTVMHSTAPRERGESPWAPHGGAGGMAGYREMTREELIAENVLCMPSDKREPSKKHEWLQDDDLSHMSD